jgi:hypothetical protein
MHRGGHSTGFGRNPKEFYREDAKDAKLREVKSNLVFSSRNFASFAPSR